MILVKWIDEENEIEIRTYLKSFVMPRNGHVVELEGNKYKILDNAAGCIFLSVKPGGETGYYEDFKDKIGRGRAFDEHGNELREISYQVFEVLVERENKGYSGYGH